MQHLKFYESNNGYTGKSMCFRALNQFDSAYYYIDKSFELEKDRDLAWNYHNLAMIQKAEGKHKEALSNFNKALEIEEEGKFYFHRAKTKILINPDDNSICDDLEKAKELHHTSKSWIVDYRISDVDKIFGEVLQVKLTLNQPFLA